MSEDSDLLNTCSKEIQKAVLFLMTKLSKDRDAIKTRIRELQSMKRDKEQDHELAMLEKKIDLEFCSQDSAYVYLMSKLGVSSIVKQYIECSKQDDFIDVGSFENTEEFYYMYKIGIGGQIIHENVRSDIKLDGQLGLNLEYHSGLLKFYVDYMPKSEITRKAIQYWLGEWKAETESEYRFIHVKEVALALEALYAYDPDKMSKEIDNHVQFLISKQHDDGSFEGRYSEAGQIEMTTFALSALSLVLPSDDPKLVKGKQYLLNILKADRTYKKHKYELPDILLALISLGDGPKISREFHVREVSKITRQLERSKPQFLETSPNLNARTLRAKIKEMIEHAEREILIISPFVDVLYEDIANKIEESKGTIKVRIITKPRRDIVGSRSRIASSVLDILNEATKGSLLVAGLAHSRMIIVDEKRMVVSSADLTSDQLSDEYNAGLYIEDEDAIKKGKAFFDNLYSLGEHLTGS